ncbi:hypothetical protein GMORB2_1727 [Geosmithia morbida]|uniref:Uncharacterized protein n=1 Tax=Geosmithia morbida TaxID=1094350 RepID=A0A9P4YSU2_9HYPO|nr:uncharacterized protein GMORB2_1727 [Geosmithia morbida]KAF4121887.1 hypothetical protein GMORB2_1727 [Geosmithia morbida]
MCGPDNSNRPRGGALAVLSPITSSRINADLAFHTPGSPTSVGATHARLTPTGDCPDLTRLSSLHVVIHSTGDLRAHQGDCGLFRQFAFPAAMSKDHVEFELDSPLAVGVGGEGIIGRRVSLCSGPVASEENTVAQGIVGFNFAPSL